MKINNAAGDQAGGEPLFEQDGGKNHAEDRQQINGERRAHHLHRLNHREIQQHRNSEAEHRHKNQAPPDVRLKMGELAPACRLHDFAKNSQFNISD